MPYIDIQQLQHRLPGNPFASGLHIQPSLPSTQDSVWAAYDRGDATTTGYGVVALEQTGGRGRQGRRWHGTAGMGLWYSCLLLKSLPASQGATLTLAAGVALQEAVCQSTSLQPTIKWPNDLLIGKKKLAGILVESRARNGQINAAVIGIGCNLSHQACDFPPEIAPLATSILIEAGHAPALDDLFATLAPSLQHWLNAPWEEVRSRWLSICDSIGKPITILTADGCETTGTFSGIDQDGALLLQTSGQKFPTRYPSAEIL